MNGKKIVCLGGGIGTVNLIKGLKKHTQHITVVVSIADDGGSAGRLRRLYGVPPPGDIVSCIAALSDRDDIARLLTYRFPGDRYGDDQSLAGHKLGNLMLVAAWQQKKDMHEGISLLQRLFQSVGTVLPATTDGISLSAVTAEGVEVQSEESIDLGKYNGQRVLERVFIHPENPSVSDEVISAINEADVIIAGPGDLYTTILPVLIIPAVKDALLSSKAKKCFIVNVANKPFETKGYSIEDFVRAIEKHLGTFPFHTVIANDNFSVKIPEKYKYAYVTLSDINGKADVQTTDLVDEAFPLYHDPEKLASLVYNEV